VGDGRRASLISKNPTENGEAGTQAPASPF
jgi:hypothetical protein